jgi:hypothetical protein
MNIGQLIRVKGVGLCTVTKIFAAKFVGVVVIDAKKTSDIGKYMYLRGFDFDNAEVV